MNIRKLREQKGWTQQELADMAGVTLRTLQNWESGKSIPASMEKLLNFIFDKYEYVSLDDAHSHGVSVAAGTGSQVTLNPDTQQFFSTLEKQQEIMSRQLEELAEQLKMIKKKDQQMDILLNLLNNKSENE